MNSRGDTIFDDTIRMAIHAHPPFAAFEGKALTDPPVRAAGEDVVPAMCLLLEGQVTAPVADEDAMVQVILEDLELFQGFVEDYEITVPLHPLELSGHPVRAMSCRYTALFRDSPDRILTHEHVWYWRQERNIFTIRLADFEHLDPRLRFDRDSFLATVRIR